MIPKLCFLHPGRRPHRSSVLPEHGAERVLPRHAAQRSKCPTREKNAADGVTSAPPSLLLTYAASLAASRAQEMEGDYKQLADREEQLSKELVQANSVWQNQKNTLAQEEAQRDTNKQQLDEHGAQQARFALRSHFSSSSSGFRAQWTHA